MKIILKDINAEQVKNQSRQSKANVRYGFWAVVVEVDSSTHCVDVRVAGGLVLKDVPVACTDEWVCEYKDEGYIAGSRNLPPINSRVFVFMPCGTYEGAFVLCSGLSMYEKAHKNAFMSKNKKQKHEKDVTRHIVRQGKWESLYNYENASYELKSPSGDEGVLVKVSDDKKNKSVNVKAFGSVLEIDKDGNIKIETKGDVSIDGKVINLNGSKNSACKTEELQKQLNIMKSRIDGIINAITQSPTGAQDGGASYKTGMISILKALQSENFSSIIDGKVKHGS